MERSDHVGGVGAPQTKQPIKYTLTPAQALEPHEAGDLHEWLTNQGIAIDSVSLLANGDVVVDADVDPSLYMTTYIAQRRDRTLDEAAQLRELESIDLANADLVELRNVVTLLRSLVLRQMH